jgi:hypothetical protein
MSNCQPSYGALINNGKSIAINNNLSINTNACNPLIGGTDFLDQSGTPITCPNNGEWKIVKNGVCSTKWDTSISTSGSVSGSASGSGSLSTSFPFLSVDMGVNIPEPSLSLNINQQPPPSTYGCKVTNPLPNVDFNLNNVDASADLDVSVGLTHLDIGASASLSLGAGASFGIPLPGYVPECQRIAYQGNPIACCVANSNSTNYTADGQVILAPGCDGINFDAKACNRNTTCDPQFTSWGSQSCDIPMTVMCANQSNSGFPSSDADNTGFQQWMQSGSCYNYISAKSSATGVDQVISNSVKSINNQWPLNNISSWKGNGHALSVWNGLLQSISNAASSSSNQALSQVCSTFTREELAKMDESDPYDKLIVDACGCHLPATQYEDYIAAMKSNAFSSCDPLCVRSGSVKNFKGGQPIECTQNNCVIDNVSLTIIDSDVNGELIFQQQCPGGRCYFSSPEIYSVASKDPKIQIEQQCAKCYVYKDGDPYNPIEIECMTGNPINQWWDNIVNFISEHKWTFIGIAIAILIIIIITAIVIVNNRKKKAEMIESAYESGMQY